MSIYKPQNSPHYQYDFQFKSHRFCGTCETGNKREAEQVERDKRAAAKAEFERRKRQAGAPLTVEAAFERYWNEVGQHHKRADQTGWSLDWLKRELGATTRVRDISDSDVATIVARRRGEAVRNAAAERGHQARQKGGAVSVPKLVSPARVNRSVTEPLRKVLRRAAETWNEDVQKIKWANHRLKEPRGRIRELSADEEERLLGAIAAQYRPIVTFAIRTGCRASECVNLPWNAVDWGNRQITILGKGDKVATVPLTPDIRDLLWAQRGRHAARVFAYDDGQPMTYWGVDSAFGRAAVRAGVDDVRFHDLRHTAATRLMRRSGNMALVRDLLRHEDISTSARYSHATQDDLRRAMEKVIEDAPNETALAGERMRKAENQS